VSIVWWCMGLILLDFLYVLTHAVSTNDAKESKKILSRIEDIQVSQAVAVYMYILY